MLPPDEKTLKTYGSDEHADIYNFKILRNGFQNQVSRNCLQRNNGDGKSFSDVALVAGGFGTQQGSVPFFVPILQKGTYSHLFFTATLKKNAEHHYYIFLLLLVI